MCQIIIQIRYIKRTKFLIVHDVNELWRFKFEYLSYSTNVLHKICKHETSLFFLMVEGTTIFYINSTWIVLYNTGETMYKKFKLVSVVHRIFLTEHNVNGNHPNPTNKTRGPWATSLTWENSSNQRTHMIIS